jgi:transposase-like protein
MIVSQAVMIAIGIDGDGRRQVLAVELANRESRSSWRDCLLGLKVSNGTQLGPRIGIQKGPLFGLGSGLSR